VVEFLLILVPVGGVALLVAVLIGSLRRRARAAARRAAMHAGGAVPLLSEPANYMGRESRRGREIRGNGRLVLTGDLLVFAMYVPARDLVIPRDAITAADTARGHAGRRVGRPLLRVAWDEGGGPERVAWWVREPDRWLAALGAPGAPPAGP